MSFDTIGIWTKSEIDATTPPSQYPIQVGTQYVSLQVNNYSPYYLSLQATATGQPFATIKPWTITPVNFGSVGTIYISVNSTLVKRETGNTSLFEGEQVFVVLSTYQDNSQVTELDPTVAANILNAVINAAIQGSVDAVIQSGQVDANISNASIDTNSTILNEYVSNNSLVKLFTDTYTISNLTNGSLTVEMGGTGTLGLYDGYVVTVHSTGSYYYDLVPIANGAFYQASANVFSSVSIDKKTGGQFETFVVTGDSAEIFDGVFVNLQNNTGSTIASDTVTFTSYGIKASVQAYATSSNPLLNQANVGEFDTVYYWNQSQSSGTNTYNIVPSSVGGYIKQITQTNFTIDGVGTYTTASLISGPTISIQNGGNQIFEGDVQYASSSTYNPNGVNPYQYTMNFPKNITQSFGSGIANQGIDLVLNGEASSTGFVIITQQGAPQVTKSIQ